MTKLTIEFTPRHFHSPRSQAPGTNIQSKATPLEPGRLPPSWRHRLAKGTIATTAIVAAIAVQAREVDLAAPVVVGTSNVLTPLVSSVRPYTNARGVQQHDMLWQINAAENGKPEFMRLRIAVTGCGSASGRVAVIDPDGSVPPADPPTQFEWRIDGSQAFDEVARRTCELAASRRDDGTREIAQH